MRTKLKVASCPWCDGKGQKLYPLREPLSNLAGALIHVEYRACDKCEGSGVIKYKAAKYV